MELALSAQAPYFARYLGSPDEQESYAWSFCLWWKGGRDLVICEGDCIPPPGAIRALLDCPEPWCSHESWVGNRYLPDTLGLVKFSAALQAQHPAAADWALRNRPNRGHWLNARQVDSSLARMLYLLKVPLHVHQPPARHLRYENEPAEQTTRPAT